MAYKKSNGLNKSIRFSGGSSLCARESVFEAAIERIKAFHKALINSKLK